MDNAKCDQCGQVKNHVFVTDKLYTCCMDCLMAKTTGVSARLVAPYMDKNWSLQFRDSNADVFHGDNEGIALLRSCVMGFLHRNDKKHWFLQGNSGNWLMFEFWTADQDYILNTCTEIADHVGKELDIGGPL